MRRFFSLCALLVFAIVAADSHAQLRPRKAKPACSQMVVTIADSWGSTSGKMWCFDRTKTGWQPAFSKPITVQLGRKGLAWGRGLRGQTERGKHKREGDGCSPAGVFKIGKIYTHDSNLPAGANYPFRTITKWDAWVDDPKLKEYNRHVVVDPKRVPAWFEKQKMRHGDFAYRWLIEVRHNSDPPKPGAGSAIFFHTQRGPNRKTAGCTTMASTDLVRVMKWLKADARPQYSLLPRAEYEKRKKDWKLPEVPKSAAKR